MPDTFYNIRLCVDCANHRSGRLFHMCVCGRSLVTGEKLLIRCEANRADLHSAACGPDGRHWKPKEEDSDA